MLGLQFDWQWVEPGIAAHVACARFAAILDGIWVLELCASRQLCRSLQEAQDWSQVCRGLGSAL